MADALELEKVDEEGKLVKCLAARPSQTQRLHKAPKQKAETAASEKDSSTELDNDNDEDYNLPGLDTPSDSESDGEQSDEVLSNAEVRRLTVYLRHSAYEAYICSGCQYSPLKDCSSGCTTQCVHKGQALNAISGH
jgi:hypothetical protein